MKIVLIGDGAVGKTALRQRFLGKGFKEDEYIMTIGADFAVQDTNIDGKTVKYQIWDLAGQPRFSAVRDVYYRGCFGALLVYDVTRPDSFTNCESWIQELWKNSGRGPVPFVLLGNKTDLREHFPNHVTKEKGLQYADELTQKTTEHAFSISYLETSAKTGQNVGLAFDTLGTNVFSWIDQQKARRK